MVNNEGFRGQGNFIKIDLVGNSCCTFRPYNNAVSIDCTIGEVKLCAILYIKYIGSGGNGLTIQINGDLLAGDYDCSIKSDVLVENNNVILIGSFYCLCKGFKILGANACYIFWP